MELQNSEKGQPHAVMLIIHLVYNLNIFKFCQNLGDVFHLQFSFLKTKSAQWSNLTGLAAETGPNWEIKSKKWQLTSHMKRHVHYINSINIIKGKIDQKNYFTPLIVQNTKIRMIFVHILLIPNRSRTNWVIGSSQTQSYIVGSIDTFWRRYVRCLICDTLS